MKNFICIVCPKGCHLNVDDEGNVSGNACIRGEKYGKQEAIDPKRTLTSTVKINSKLIRRLPVITSGDVPKDKVQETLFLLTSKGYRSESIPTEFLKKTVNTLLSRFDYVFIDCPAGIDVGFHRAIALAKEAIVVTTPHVSAIKDASSVIAILKSYSFTRIGYALNRVRGDMVVSLTMAEAKDVSEALEIPPIAIIPENDGINTLSSVGRPLKEGSDGAKAIKVMCDNIENGTNIVIDLTRRYKGILGAVRRLIKNKV